MDRNFRNETYFPATSFYVLSRVLNMYPGIEPRSPALQMDSLPPELQTKPKNTGVGGLSLLSYQGSPVKSNPTYTITLDYLCLMKASTKKCRNQMNRKARER